MIRKFDLILFVFIFAQLVLSSLTCTKSTFIKQDILDETTMERDARMKWWRDARFGMFIHWGVYAVPAGTYNDQQIKGIGEWILLRGQIPVAEYREFAKEFNPLKYDPDAWVRLAKEAGMKYIVITSKHHDGFALYDSKVTEWDVVDATPYGKELLRPLEQACKKHGLRLGFYYSQAQDWVHPGGAKSGMEEGEGWDETHKGSFDEYLEKIAYPQVKEILSGYDIDVLWWDTPRWMNKERADKLLPLLKLRPGIIWNNRLGGEYRGDFGTPEQHIPDTGLDYDWETCMTMNKTWGFKSYDQNWKSTKTLIQNLIDIASKGGNYLLNVGPTKEGLIPEASIQRLKEIGAWMKVNGESIYGTTASPFEKPEWGRFTKKAGKLFVHIFDWPQNRTLTIPVKDLKLSSVYLLRDARKNNLKIEYIENGILVHVPKIAPDPIASVIVLEYEG
jgi:alpha-L-fucosidase